MIGVIAGKPDRKLVAEFFELFKTPWEFAKENRHYSIAISFGSLDRKIDADLVVVYSSENAPTGAISPKRLNDKTGPHELRGDGLAIPVYKGCVAYPGAESPILFSESETVGYKTDLDGVQYALIGYDLLLEIEYLLTEGQPMAFAEVPTLDNHIGILRNIMISSGIRFVEIPPSPFGYKFTVCLSHDIDHPRVRLHKFDNTMLGFAYRASLGSLLGIVKGRTKWRAAARNFIALLKLPLVHLGLIKDFWDTFEEYIEKEGESKSTFFAIPFKDKAGKHPISPRHSVRASSYGANDIGESLRKIAKSGREVAVHGLDSWADSDEGEKERNEIAPYYKRSEVGIRMHWLYFKKESFEMLDKAGFTYDSTFGYNGCVGFRAGTTQAFKPFETEKLLELPMHFMDTAFFYPTHLHLNEAEAEKLMLRLSSHAEKRGGTITINWHDRSVAPERNWGDLYFKMIRRWKSQGAWFPTMGEAAAWFRKRRSIAFERGAPQMPHAEAEQPSDGSLPGFIVREYNGERKDHGEAWFDSKIETNYTSVSV